MAYLTVDVMKLVTKVECEMCGSEKDEPMFGIYILRDGREGCLMAHQSCLNAAIDKRK